MDTVQVNRGVPPQSIKVRDSSRCLKEANAMEPGERDNKVMMRDTEQMSREAALPWPPGLVRDRGHTNNC